MISQDTPMVNGPPCVDGPSTHGGPLTILTSSPTHRGRRASPTSLEAFQTVNLLVPPLLTISNGKSSSRFQTYTGRTESRRWNAAFLHRAQIRWQRSVRNGLPHFKHLNIFFRVLSSRAVIGASLMSNGEPAAPQKPQNKKALKSFDSRAHKKNKKIFSLALGPTSSVNVHFCEQTDLASHGLGRMIDRCISITSP